MLWITVEVNDDRKVFAEDAVEAKQPPCHVSVSYSSGATITLTPQEKERGGGFRVRRGS